MEDNHSNMRNVLRKRDLQTKRRPGSKFYTNYEIEKIEDCEREIRIIDEQESEEKLTVFRTYMSLLKPLFNVRSKIIESIPKFWSTVIEYHPKLTYLITEEATEVLQHVKRLEVDTTDTTYFKITLVFEENPYIENKVIIKELSSCSNKEFVSVSTPIKWKTTPLQDKSELQTEGSRKRKSENTSFFTWFCDDDSKEKNTIVNSFDEIWQNPLPFFLLGIMDNEVDDFVDVGNCDMDIDTIEDEEDVIAIDENSSNTMDEDDDDDSWCEDDEEAEEEVEEEEEEEEEESESGEDEERDEGMDDDNEEDD